MRKMRSRQGYTLVEIMVVVVVLAILDPAEQPNIIGQGRDDQARVSVARSDINNFSTMLQSFKLDMRRFPTEAEGLQVLREPPSSEDANLWRGPYATRDIPRDPWGNDYIYTSPAPNGLDEFGVVSYGSDKMPGGEGFARDISSWENYETEEEM